jgi:hypothetical protein
LVAERHEACIRLVAIGKVIAKATNPESSFHIEHFMKGIVMKKLTLTLAALATITLLSLSVSSANAQGFGWYVSSRPVYKTQIYGYAPKTVYHRPGFGASAVVVGDYDHHDYVWHDTSHLHYRPSRLVLHGDHFHYQPGQYEVHHTGHWDHVH